MNKYIYEVLRVSPILGLAGLILLPDDSRGVVLFGLGIILLAVGVAHLIRKLLFPYIDVRALAEKAKETSLSSALVILGLLYLLSTIIQSLVLLLK